MNSVIKLNNVVITENTTRFSGGEVQLRIPESLDLFSGANYVEAHISCSDGVMLLCQLASLIEGGYNRLYLPYLPYSRYDHRDSLRDPLSLKVFASIINSLNFSQVILDDCHSDVGLALIDRCSQVPQHAIVMGYFDNDIYEYDAIVSPDTGSLKKATKLAKEIGKPVIKCDKVRDFKTGEIIGFSANTEGHIHYEKVLIVDDICDGGGTFAGLSEELNKIYPVVDLFVTHGIFSKGKDLLYDSGISTIYAYHDWSEA